MKERPILFSGGMVRAILSGAKTQTRRVLKRQPPDDGGELFVDPYFPTVTRKGQDEPGPRTFGVFSDDGEWCLACPFGEPGDRLWVRETWGLHAPFDLTDWCRDSIVGADVDGLLATWEVDYRADWQQDSEPNFWRPSILMPRWASRITLEVTGVRVERLGAISDEDGRAEGYSSAADFLSGDWARGVLAGAAWAQAPWVWAISFRHVEAKSEAA